MVSKWKSLVAAASVLLLVGAGCDTTGQQGTSVETNAVPPAPSVQVGTKTEIGTKVETSAISEADAAVDAALKESDGEASIMMDADADADIVNNDSAELNAYGQAYDQNEIK